MTAPTTVIVTTAPASVAKASLELIAPLFLAPTNASREGLASITLASALKDGPISIVLSKCVQMTATTVIATMAHVCVVPISEELTAPSQFVSTIALRMVCASMALAGANQAGAVETVVSKLVQTIVATLAGVTTEPVSAILNILVLTAVCIRRTFTSL